MSNETVQNLNDYIQTLKDTIKKQDTLLQEAKEDIKKLNDLYYKKRTSYDILNVKYSLLVDENKKLTKQKDT